MKIKNIKIGESHQLKTAKKSRESLGKLFSEYEIEEIEDIIRNTYDNSQYECYECCPSAEHIVIEKDLNDKKFNVRIKNAKGHTVWTNAHCLKK